MRQGQSAASDLATAERDAVDATESVQSIESQIASLNERLADAKLRKDATDAAVVPRRAELERLRELVKTLADNSEAIRTAGEVNRQADAWDRRVELVAKSKAIAGDIDAVKAKIESIESERSEMLLNAKFPVEGLSFSVDGVLFNGLPFDSGNQCQSDILRVGVAIAVAQDPALKIVRIKDGSLLDGDAKAQLLAMLAEHGFQAFIETVADCGLTALTIEETVA